MASSNGIPRHGDHTRSLQQAASTIFVLMGLMPFLIFVWVAYLLNAMDDLRVQIGLALALAISMLGFSVLLVTMRRTSQVLQLLLRAEAPRYAAPLARDASGERAPSAKSEPDKPLAPTKAKYSAKPTVDFAPAIGSIKELRDATDAVGRRWREEAERLIGQRVRVDVQNLDEPEVGTITRVTADGLVLETNGSEFGILWRLVTSIELDAAVVESVPQSAG
jgi:hypothetical protein